MLAGNIKNYILDSSFVLSYLLPDEQVDEVEKVFKEYTQGLIRFISSSLLPYEIINGLKYALISKRIDKNSSILLIQGFQMLEIALTEVDLEKVFKISIKEKLSVYDASYVYLAKKHHLKLLSLDARLRDLAS